MDNPFLKEKSVMDIETLAMEAIDFAYINGLYITLLFQRKFQAVFSVWCCLMKFLKFTIIGSTNVISLSLCEGPKYIALIS